MMQPSCLSTAQYSDIGPYSTQAIPCYCPAQSKTGNIPADRTGTQIPCGDAMGQGRPTGMGTLIFKPQEIKLQDATKQIDAAYCQVKLGLHREKIQTIRSPGMPEQMALRYKGQDFADVKIKEKGLFIKNTIGEGKIQLGETIRQGRSNQWVPLSKKGQVVGEIHFLIEFVPETV